MYLQTEHTGKSAVGAGVPAVCEIVSVLETQICWSWLAMRGISVTPPRLSRGTHLRSAIFDLKKHCIVLTGGRTRFKTTQ